MTPISTFLSSLALLLPLAAGAPCANTTTTTAAAAPNFLGVPIKNVDAKDTIPNAYIVVYNKTIDDDTVVAHQQHWVATIAKRNIGKRSEIDNRWLSSTAHTFSIGTMRAMSLDADDATMIEINSADEVAYIEQDARVKLNALTTQANAPTGLARLSASAAGGTDYVFDDSAGAGITAFIVDTGVMAEHSEFEGRATFAANFVNNVDTDENGHGSHVCGTIGGKTFGVAKKVTIMGVKVLDADGAGTNSGVIAGMNFVAQTANSTGLAGKAVMNMSLGGSKSNAVNAAIDALRAAGVVPVVAAGNEAVDASNDSPASAAGAITVGAIDQTSDRKASFSNFGRFVDVFAPGVNVQSVGITSTTANATLSGTSMASPHIAGLAAYLMAFEKITDIDAVAARIMSLATASNSTVLKNTKGTTSLIANNGHL